MTPYRSDVIKGEIAMMRKAQVAVYHMAMQAEALEFLVFAALMSAYADLCDEALAQGIDYVEDAHLAKAHGHKGRYIGEKLGRLLGPWMEGSPAFREQLLRYFLEST